MIDLITVAVALLTASSLLLPLLQLYKGRNWNLSGYILAAVLGGAILLVTAFTLNPTSVPWFGSLLSPDQLGGVFALVTLGVTLAVVVASLDFQRTSFNPVYYSLLSFTALGMLLLSYSQDLLMLFVAWELMSLPTYVLAGFDKKIRSNEAAVKYAVIGAIGTYFVNVIRITLIVLYVTYVSLDVEAFHDSIGEVLFITWIFIFLLAIIRMENKRFRAANPPPATVSSEGKPVVPDESSGGPLPHSKDEPAKLN
jgi:exosortase/archaeosortase family protein